MMTRKSRGTIMVVMAVLAMMLFYELTMQDTFQRPLSSTGTEDKAPVVPEKQQPVNSDVSDGATAMASAAATTSTSSPGPARPTDGPFLVPKPGTHGDKFAPEAYYMQPDETGRCENLYGMTYLRTLVDSATEYCEPTSSSTKMTCFMVTQCDKSPEDCEDHFCVAKNVAVDMLAMPDTPLNEDWRIAPRNESEKPLLMDCKLREWSEDSGVTPVDDFRKYMFDTGPHETFRHFIKNVTFAEEGQMEKAKSLCKDKKDNKEWYIFFKRDGTNIKGTHPWHGGMELFSMFLTLDVLRSGPNPMFTEADMENAQVVLMDDFPGGDFESLWQMFAKKPILRMNTLKKKLEEEGDTCLDNVVIPLPGASNPMWKGDWRASDCHSNILLDTFVDRLLSHYRVTPSERRPDAPLRVTFLDRPKRRKLHDKKRLLDMAEKKFPEVEFKDVNLWDMTMADRIRVMTETDLLVGVHGSELTFGMFMPPESSMVEIQPEAFNHYGFRNQATMRGQRYFKAHAKVDKDLEGVDRAWQKTVEVTIGDEEWMALIQAGVWSIMNRGTRSQDVA